MERKLAKRKITGKEEKDKIFLLKIPAEVHRKLKTRAAEDQTTMGQIILELIQNHCGRD